MSTRRTSDPSDSAPNPPPSAHSATTDWVRPVMSRKRRYSALVLTVLAYWLVCFAPYNWNAPASYIRNDAQLLQAVEQGDRRQPVLVFSGAGQAELVLPTAPPNWQTSPEQFALKATLKCTREQQFGPARIFSLSRDTLERNLTLGQDGTALVIRLRRAQSNKNGVPQLRVEEFFAGCVRRDIQLSIEGGELELTSAGKTLIALEAPEATLERWLESYPVLLGNEGTWDRGWSGEISGLWVGVNGHDLINGFEHAELAPGAWLLSRRAQGTHRFTLVPFSKEHPLAWRDNLFNVLGFVPFGVLLAFGWASRLNVLLVAFLAMTLSASIEFGQIGFEGRFPSATDVVTNTSGGVVGFLVGKLLLRRHRRAHP